MSELKEKIAEAIGNHISISDTYTYELTRVKTAFEAGTISLEDFEEWSDENVNNLAESIVDVLQPQLNDNQQIVLRWLMDKYTVTNIEPVELIWRLKVNSVKTSYRNMPVYKNYRYMTKYGQAKVLQIFSQWVLDQEGTE
ncbi:hypothetical protein M4I17_08365 [Enterococcus thailandicus]|uniref:hypothetical protein n=1 Tax=Enterococcus thailandicus TaxID=417368 RepID=UPI002543CDE1|nr:hypothetical protein [Enterococcus thailandicus]MDK4352421.1 hypothetical protein [Enterococcus thailandicus]MDT2733838.1 hypothetical protein [Enterococcus thailandicus]